MFASARDAEMRLAGSIVRLAGKPVYVEGVAGKELVIFDPSIRDTRSVPWDSPEFDFSSAPLGYMNYRGHALFSCRTPHRRYKQGISRDSLKVEHVASRDVLNTDSMYDCVSGNYPNLATAVDMLTTNNSVAFHRWWMVKKEDGVSLYHRGTRVGKVVRGKPILNVDKRFLKECLEASIV